MISLTCLFSHTGSGSPQSLAADSVGTDQLNLSWSVSAFMQMTPHSYNVTTCASSCATLLYSYTNGSAFMNVSIGNLTSATEYSIRIAAFVVRRDSVTGGRTTLQSNPTDLQVKTGRRVINAFFCGLQFVLCCTRHTLVFFLSSVADSCEQHKVIAVVLKLLKLVSLAPPLWILYRILKKGTSPVLSEKMYMLKYSSYQTSMSNTHPSCFCFLLRRWLRRR